MIPTDKLLHFSISCILAQLCIYTFGEWIGVAICIAVGVIKEYSDSKQPGNHFCWWDILADIVGSAAGLLLYLLISAS